jgi:transcriptional regulator with XRE-family HTH domain
MSRRFKRTTPRGRHFIAEWRQYKGLTQTELSGRVGLSKSQISKIESHQEIYTQDTLEEIAAALGERPSCLIEHPPGGSEDGSEDLAHRLRQIPPGLRRRQAIRLLETLIDDLE